MPNTSSRPSRLSETQICLTTPPRRFQPLQTAAPKLHVKTGYFFKRGRHIVKGTTSDLETPRRVRGLYLLSCIRILRDGPVCHYRIGREHSDSGPAAKYGPVRRSSRQANRPARQSFGSALRRLPSPIPFRGLEFDSHCSSLNLSVSTLFGFHFSLRLRAPFE